MVKYGWNDIETRGSIGKMFKILSEVLASLFFKKHNSACVYEREREREKIL